MSRLQAATQALASSRRLATEASRSYVAQEPLKSALMAAALGGLGAALVMALFRGRRDTE